MTETGRNPFRIAQPGAPVGVEVTRASNGSGTAEERVAEMVSAADVFAFIKGSPSQPLCGFSANTVAVLEALGVPYSTFDVLSNESIRMAAKSYASWPTFPQVYIRGDLVGGNDIVSEMYASGELQALTGGIR